MSEEKRETLVLIDGHGLAYRMYFALSREAFNTRSGEPTNATYGFTRTLLNYIAGEPPPHYLAVSFDVGATFRDAMYVEYKATRAKMPDDLEVQIGRIHDVLKAFNVPTLEVDGYEADDVLGTVCRMAGELGLDVLIVTGDKDLLQLVDEHTIVELPGRRTGSGEVERYDIVAVKERFGVGPDQFVDYKALIGDKSDNIPGVAGIGEKTAVQLLQEYGTLENIYDRLEAIKSNRVRTALEQGRDNAFLSQTLSRIVTDVPLELKMESCRTRDFERDDVVSIFRELEFRSLIDLLPGGPSERPAQPGEHQLSLFGTVPAVSVTVKVEAPTKAVSVQDEKALEALIQRLSTARMIAFDTETTSTNQMVAKLVGIALAIEPGEGYYIPVGHIDTDEQQLQLDYVIERLRPIFTDPAIPKIGHNLKYDAIVLERHGLRVKPLSFDTMIGQWLLYPEGSRGKLGLKAQAFMRLGIEMTEIGELIGTGKNQITMDRVPIGQCSTYAAADADMTLRLYEPIRGELAENRLESLFYNIEMPLVPVLCAMEQAGVLVDTETLGRFSKELGEAVANLEEEICRVIGYKCNLNSPQQLSDALFGALSLPTQGLRKTRTGFYSTAADVLDSLREVDTTGIINLLMQFRELEKLRSTYVDALPTLVNPQTGRIHTSFNQTMAVTGRLSSSDPNLQNIPIRSETGRRVRKAFTAAPGCKLVSADYSQVELRILAHVSGDERLRDAFREDQDIHATTAAAVYGIPIEQVTRTQRSFAKSVNFGVLYGMGAFRLARESNLTLSEAEDFIRTYFERFPKVRQYLDGTRRMAVEQGYVETLLGRRRYFPELQGFNKRQDQARAEREAINMPIQGTAADIIKIAMIRLDSALSEQGLMGRMTLQVHDELLLEVPEEEVEIVVPLVKQIMENAYPMDVPLRADVGVGRNWGEMK